jgi:asparagine synthase (glutamine-hydrolysing)
MCGIFLVLKKKDFIDNYYNNFMKIKHRGPNNSVYITLNNPLNMEIGFHRLSINDLTSAGDQPFKYENKERTVYAMCNGEIYNHKEVEEKYGLVTKSGSDCEVIIEMYKKFGEESIRMMSEMFDSEHAFIIVDINTKTGDYTVCFSSDRLGIRPLFIGSDDNGYYFSSELKGLPKSCITVERFKPRNYAILRKIDGKIGDIEYKEYFNLDDIKTEYYDIESAKKVIKESFTNAVKIRLESDKPIGCLLSGGVDSSLVSAIISREFKKQGKTLNTYSIGMPGSTDEKYAKIVAKHIGSNHTHIELSENDFLSAIPDVIKTIESYDITTVRASTAQYLIGKWMSENTNIKVLGVGEMSDELNGSYLYFKKAPSPEEFDKECKRLMNDIHFFDVIRCDRCISANGIEVRLPFADIKYITETLKIDPKLRMPYNNIEKYLLRKAFDDDNLLPTEVLWREKCAQSDGISSTKRSWFEVIRDSIKVENIEEENKKNYYKHLVPIDKESLHYRKIFTEYYGNEPFCKVIPYYWLPRWCGTVTNPSARILDVCNESK